MQIGLVFPQLEIGSDPGRIREYAETADGLGYEHLVAFDHVLGADRDRDDPRMEAWPLGAYGHEDEFHEPLTLFAFLAGITKELELTTGILVLPQRQTALVAKQATEIDLLSGGRLRLGVGIGWNHLEYEALGVPWDERGRRMTEQIAVLRSLWEEPLVDLEGDFHSLPRVGLKPLPGRRIPIWTGSNSGPGLRRAVRHTDGVMAAFAGHHRGAEAWIEKVREALDEVGRDPSVFGIEGRLDLYNRNLDQTAEDLQRWRELGATHLSVSTLASTRLRHEPSPFEQHLEKIIEFRQLLPIAG